CAGNGDRGDGRAASHRMDAPGCVWRRRYRARVRARQAPVILAQVNVGLIPTGPFEDPSARINYYTVSRTLSGGLGQTAQQSWFQPPPNATMLLGLLDTASMAASAYHGYKRNNSVGWALWWGLMGSLAPVLTPVVAVAQGFGKPRKR